MALAGLGETHRVGVFRREGFFLPEVERTCGPVYHLDIHRLVGPNPAGEVWKLSRWLRREQMDLVHAWDADAEIFGSWAAQLAGIPLITSRRDLGEIYPWYKLRLMARADRKARSVVVNSLAIRNRLVEQGHPAHRLVHIPNALDLSEFDRLAAEPFREASLPAGRLVGMVARLDPEKDASVFLRAAALVRQRFADVTFVIAGEGPQRAGLEAECRALGIADSVVFLGEVRAVPALVSRMEAGVLVPKANEGLSNTLLEYMAAAKPSVATDCGGNRELVEDGVTGFLVPIGDHRAVADALAALLADPSRAAAFGRNARERVVTRHDLPAVAARFSRLYRQAISSSASRD